MMESWKVGVIFHATSNIAQVMSSASKATLLTNSAISKQNSVLSTNAARIGALREKIAQTQAVARVATGVFTGFAVASGAALIEGIKGAADLETAMTGIGIATHATRKQMEMLRQTAFNVSATTAQSVVDSARVMQIMASSGINNANQLQQIALPAAKFADVQFLKSQGKVSFEDAARQAIQIAHLYQAYSPQKISPILDSLTKLSFMMPDDLNRYLTQSSYYLPVFRRLGVSDEQSLVAGAFIDRMGLGRGKGGTGLQQFLLHQLGALQISNHQQQGMRSALSRLGLLNADGSARYYQNGRFDIIGSLEQIDSSIQAQTKGLKGRAVDLVQQRAIIDIQKALGIQGGRIGFLGTTEAIQQLHQMVQQLRDPRTVGVNEAQARYMDTLNGRFQQFRTNFSSLLTELLYPWLGRLKGAFGTTAQTLHNWQEWLHQHRDAEKLIGAGLIATFVGSVSAVGATSIIAAKRVWDLQRAILALSVTGGPGIPGGGGSAAGGKLGFIARARNVIWDALNWFTLGIPNLLVTAITKWHGTLTPAIVRVTDQILSKALDQVWKIKAVGPALVEALLPVETALTELAGFAGGFGGFLLQLAATRATPEVPGAISGHSLQFWRKFIHDHPAYNAPPDVRDAIGRANMDAVKPGDTHIHIHGNITLPHVKNGQDLVNELKNYSNTRTTGPVVPTLPTRSRFQHA